MVCYLRDVVSQLELRDLQSGAIKKQLPMPGLGSVASFSGRLEDTQLFFLFTGFTEPGAIYQCDLFPPSCTPEWQYRHFCALLPLKLTLTEFARVPENLHVETPLLRFPTLSSTKPSFHLYIDFTKRF